MARQCSLAKRTHERRRSEYTLRSARDIRTLPRACTAFTSDASSTRFLACTGRQGRKAASQSSTLLFTPRATFRGLQLFRFQLNLSSFVHRVTQLNPECVLELLKLSSNVNECKPLATLW